MAYSKTVLKGKLEEMGISHHYEPLVAMGLDTMAKVAFKVNIMPNAVDIDEVDEEILKPLATKDGEVDELEMPMLRVLWWACYAATTENIKHTTPSSTTTSTPRTYTSAEISAKRDGVWERLVGLTKCPELMPSDQLIRRCLTMYATNRVAYIPWERCTSLPVEVIGDLTDSRLKRVGNTVIVEEALAELPDAPVNNALLLEYALKRRGLALDAADIMPFEAHEKLRLDLLRAKTADPVPGYKPAEDGQLRYADQLAFTILANACASGIHKDGDEYPMQMKLPEVFSDRVYTQALAQKETKGAAGKPAAASSSWEVPEGMVLVPAAGKGKKRKTPGDAATQPKGKGGGGSGRGNEWKPKNKDKGKGKDKGAGKAKTAWDKLPAKLRVNGADGDDTHKGHVCHKFNLGECKDAPPGGYCARGAHICIMKWCRGKHSFVQNHWKLAKQW